MKEKITFSSDLNIRQDLWIESPCSGCRDSHCCGNLPLTPLKLENQNDFINLLLISSYNGFFTGLKKSGEWTVFLERKCAFLDRTEGKCSIHGEPAQSLICKSYDSHNCWYLGAFDREKYTSMIRFSTDMLIWYEKRHDLLKNRFEIPVDWIELCDASREYRKDIVDLNPDTREPWLSHKLSFEESRSSRFLFLPPYNRPEQSSHFELLSFRLGFPGVYLAVSDNMWAFMIRTDLNPKSLDLIRGNYYPSIAHRDGLYSFERVFGEKHPFSEIGEQWVILEKPDLPLLKVMTLFNKAGDVRRLPTTAELLEALKSRTPNRAA